MELAHVLVVFNGVNYTLHAQRLPSGRISRRSIRAEMARMLNIPQFNADFTWYDVANKKHTEPRLG